MKMRAEKRALDKIYRRRDRYEIPDWQREEVWPIEKKQLLIDTILRNWRLPKFYFLKVSSNPDEYEVVDGQQRLAAIFEFYDNELCLAGSTSRLYKAQYYKELSEELQDRFDDYEIDYDEITEADDIDLKEFFQRLQEGLPLTSSEKLNAIHSNLRDFTKKLSNHEFFKNKVKINDKRYAHFDIVAKVATIEIEGIDTGLRFDDIKTTFESQIKFSPRSNVAQRLNNTFDRLDCIFLKRSNILRNRTVIQSFATLIAYLIASGKEKGKDRLLEKFFLHFVEELSRQVTLGQQATDQDYLEFQKTVNSNVRRNAQIRNKILLRKLLVFDPHFADLLGNKGIIDSDIVGVIQNLSEEICGLIHKKNEEYAARQGEYLFKQTNKTTAALIGLKQPILNYGQYQKYIDNMYFLFRESVGSRITVWPVSFQDVNDLRTSERHDIDHGKKSSISAKRKKIGQVFKKYSGELTPDTLDPEKFVIMQTKLLNGIAADLKSLNL